MELRVALELKPWDVVDHLASKEAILAYLEAVFEDGDPALIASAIQDVARAKGVSGDPALSADSDITAIIRTLKSLGLELTAKAA